MLELKAPQHHASHVFLRAAHSTPVVETRTHTRTTTHSRPDICALSAMGGEDLLRVCIASPITPYRLRTNASPLDTLRHNAIEESWRHEDSGRHIGPATRVVPLIFSVIRC